MNAAPPEIINHVVEIAGSITALHNNIKKKRTERRKKKINRYTNDRRMNNNGWVRYVCACARAHSCVHTTIYLLLYNTTTTKVAANGETGCKLIILITTTTERRTHGRRGMMIPFERRSRMTHFRWPARRSAISIQMASADWLTNRSLNRNRFTRPNRFNV